MVTNEFSFSLGYVNVIDYSNDRNVVTLFCDSCERRFESEPAVAAIAKACSEHYCFDSEYVSEDGKKHVDKVIDELIERLSRKRSLEVN